MSILDIESSRKIQKYHKHNRKMRTPGLSLGIQCHERMYQIIHKAPKYNSQVSEMIAHDHSALPIGVCLGTYEVKCTLCTSIGREANRDGKFMEPLNWQVRREVDKR